MLNGNPKLGLAKRSQGSRPQVRTQKSIAVTCGLFARKWSSVRGVILAWLLQLRLLGSTAPALLPKLVRRKDQRAAQPRLHVFELSLQHPAETTPGRC